MRNLQKHKKSSNAQRTTLTLNPCKRSKAKPKLKRNTAIHSPHNHSNIITNSPKLHKQTFKKNSHKRHHLYNTHR